MRELVKTFVDEAFDDLKVKPELKDFLKRHERKNELINRLTHQFLLAEKSNFGKKLTREMIKDAVADFVKLFGFVAKVEANNKSKTYVQSLKNDFARELAKSNPDASKDLIENDVRIETL